MPRLDTDRQVQIKLTPVQNKVVWCLQNGWVLLTDNTIRGAEVANDANNNFHINNGVLRNLIDKDVVWQELSYPFHYILTPTGERTETKIPKLLKINQ